MRFLARSLALLGAGALAVSAGWFAASRPGPRVAGGPPAPDRSGRAGSVGAEALDAVLELGHAGGEDLAGFDVVVPDGDGPKVRALYSRPPGDGRFPAVVLNHGGFDGFSRSFLGTARQWTEAGFVVAASEYRGEGASEGRADYGGGEVDDVISLVKWLRGRPEVDPRRIAMVGYSRGATVTLLALERSVPVTAAAVYSPVTDLASLLEDSERVTAILERRDLAFDPADPRQIRGRSPILGADRIQVPVLVLHGEDDPLVPASQSVAFADAVRSAGGDVTLRVYPGAAHHLKDYPGTFEAARAFVAGQLAASGPPPVPAWAVTLTRDHLPLPPADPYGGVRHGGIYQRMSYKEIVQRPGENANHPLLAGADFNVPWANVEPERDRYDWTWVDKPLHIWSAAGKRVALNVVTMSPRGANPTAGHVTPEWVFARGAVRVTVETRGRGRTAGMTSDYPLLSDPVYLREYEDFIAAFAARYDGDPAIDVVTIGVAKLGGLTIVDAKISPEERKTVSKFLADHGYTRERHFETVKEICRIYLRHFHKTPLRINLSNFFVKDDLSPENLAYFSKVGDWAASQGINLFYQGFTGGERYVRKMRQKPIDEIFHRNSSRVMTGGEMVDPIWGSRTDFMGKIGEAVDNALGTTPGLEPTGITWLNLYVQDCGASNPSKEKFDPEWYRAVLRAYEGLRLVPPPPGRK